LWFNENYVKELKFIGYEYSEPLDLLTMKIDISRFDNSIEVKRILSRVFYEVYGFEELDDPFMI